MKRNREKKPKKSKLERQREDCHSTYWCKKCDAIISEHFRGRPCIVCGTRVGTAGHHLIGRDNKLFRHDLNNLVALCPLHHIWGAEHNGTEGYKNMSAHGTPARFAAWLETNRQETWRWICESLGRPNEGPPDYQARYARLLVDLEVVG